ncbi:energy transducer TonB [Cytophagaceae bacterium DM2B3-1]|uniref:Energy transducer TonB n=1 Tax=Xanthocytophaga flava TaxID=3048013 RepID=A0ABT7CP56_9BACT|nr:energy transducer TonB [Xanthocytophaga flavus]MDJ1469944.1 energy transducer TonB [Xanthocytophaga flavus]MDJ1494454.1 energy transducer TonB [Xanthocytophaga flavus]
MYKAIVILFSIFLLSIPNYAQVKQSKLNTSIPKTLQPLNCEQPLFWTAQLAQYPEGISALYTLIQKNLRYPALARNNKVQGTIYAGFIIDEKGFIKSPQILQGLGYGCDEEVVRVLNLIPQWVPAQQNGRNTAIKYILPISFYLAI